MTTKPRHLVAIVAVTAATALLLAPAAGAASDCRNNGGSTMCQRPGHSSLHTAPAQRTPAGGLFGSAWLPGYGRGQLPPLLALD